MGKRFHQGALHFGDTDISTDYGNDLIIITVERDIRGDDMTKVIVHFEVFGAAGSIHDMKHGIGKGDISLHGILQNCIYEDLHILAPDKILIG